MKTVLTVIACMVVGVVGALGFIYSGVYDVSALTPDNPIVKWAVHKTSDISVNARLAGIVVPTNLDDPQMVQAGGQSVRAKLRGLPRWTGAHTDRHRARSQSRAARPIPRDTRAGDE